MILKVNPTLKLHHLIRSLFICVLNDQSFVVPIYWYMYTSQQPGLHNIKTNISRGESSSAASRQTTIMQPKEKGEMTDAQDPNEGIKE